MGNFPLRHTPRVCRVYELPEQGDPRKTAEITEFDTYVEHIAATPDAAYFAVTGTSTMTGERTRLIHLHDGLTGKQIGAIPTKFPPGSAPSIMRFDPKGSRLHVFRDIHDLGRADLFEIPSLKHMGFAANLLTVNAGGSRWVSLLTNPANARQEFILREQDRALPLLTIVRDVRFSGAEGMKFSPDGNQIVWGNHDGTVTVCDLNEVQKRLAPIRFGW